MKSKKLELLAPAQNLKTAVAAINCGADAVYIGANSFGARKMAANPIADIETLIKYAHKFNVKVYVTINTILTDGELLQAEKLINKLYEIGADAIIIQDLGLLELNLPNIEIHMSTQCDIKTLEKVKFFEKVGASRVILARELTLEQIENIAKNTNIELETFIHGALCVSYSGNCYMSAYLGGRSANRGECAQACRRKYSLIDKNGKILVKDKYLLSLKDFCAHKHLDGLIKAGVKSFKIEGRLKDEIYVKNVVLYYRRLLDKYEKTSVGEIFSDFTPDINKTFNRGYTAYFLGEKEDIFNFDTPKSTGEFLGKVSYIGKNFFELEKSAEIHPQDGLCFYSKGKLTGCLVNKFENRKIYPNRPVKLKIGDNIFRNQNVKFENDVKNSKTKRLIKANLAVLEDKITLTDGKNTVSLPLLGETAQNKEKTKENFIKSFKKTGEGIFYIDKIAFNTDKLPFLPISSLNKLRRDIFLKLENLRLEKYETNGQRPLVPAKFYDRTGNYKLNIHNKKAEFFYKKCGVENIEKSVEFTKNFKNKELMRCKHCIRRALRLCLKSGNKNTPLFLVNETGEKFGLEFDCKNCEMAVIKN